MVYTLVCSRDTTLPKMDERAFYRYINKGIFIAKVFRADSFQINLHISCFELIRLQHYLASLPPRAVLELKAQFLAEWPEFLF